MAEEFQKYKEILEREQREFKRQLDEGSKYLLVLSIESKK